MNLRQIISIILINITIPTTPTTPESNLFLNEDHTPGFITIRHNIEVFYWLFRSRAESPHSPLIIWLEGGPGCSSQQAIFLEHGPFRIHQDGQSLYKNIYSWNNIADVLYIDQPVGTGYTNVGDGDLLAGSKQQIIEDFMGFWEGWVGVYKEYRERDIYLVGHSYGGKYVPYYGKALVERGVNIRGISIGNGDIDREIIYKSYPEFAYENELISTSTYLTTRMGLEICELFLHLGWVGAGDLWCNILYMSITGIHESNFSPMDIRPDHPDISTHLLYKFLNMDILRSSIGVLDKTWSNCNIEVKSKLRADRLSSSFPELKYLSEVKGMKLVLYYGIYDFICNLLSGERTLQLFQWEGGDWVDFYVNGEVKGVCRQFLNGRLFCKVFNAGHLAVWDQPQWALDMIANLLYGL